MNKSELIELLKNVDSQEGDEEDHHGIADQLLLEYIDDEEVTEAFKNIKKWYA